MINADGLITDYDTVLWRKLAWPIMQGEVLKEQVENSERLDLNNDTNIDENDYEMLMNLNLYLKPQHEEINFTEQEEAILKNGKNTIEQNYNIKYIGNKFALTLVDFDSSLYFVPEFVIESSNNEIICPIETTRKCAFWNWRIYIIL